MTVHRQFKYKAIFIENFPLLFATIKLSNIIMENFSRKLQESICTLQKHFFSILQN